MGKQELLKTYMIALLEAINNDHINYGYLVKSPEWYLTLNTENEIENYYNSKLDKEFNEFHDLVAYYFDAKSHNFPDLQGIPLELVREKILTQSLKYCS
jgi:hypothetical protein